MNQQKKQRLQNWSAELAPHTVASSNGGVHLRLEIGQRMVDVWPITGKYQVNNGQSHYCTSPAHLLRCVQELPDVPPTEGMPELEPVARPSMVVQLKQFEYTIGGPTELEQINAWLAENAASVEFVDVKILQMPTDQLGYESWVLVYKMKIEL